MPQHISVNNTNPATTATDQSDQIPSRESLPNVSRRPFTVPLQPLLYQRTPTFGEVATMLAQKMSEKGVEIDSEVGQEMIKNAVKSNIYLQAKITLRVRKCLNMMKDPLFDRLKEVVDSMRAVYIFEPEEEVIKELFPERDVQEIMDMIRLLLLIVCYLNNMNSITTIQYFV